MEPMQKRQLPPETTELVSYKGEEAYFGYRESGRYDSDDVPESGGIVEHWRILCRYKVTIIVMTFLGAVVGVLLTLPQNPVYQARAALEIQNINQDFLNIKQV